MALGQKKGSVMQILEIPVTFPSPLPFRVELGWGRAVVFDIGMGKKDVDIYFLRLNRPCPTSTPRCTTPSLLQEQFGLLSEVGEDLLDQSNKAL